uniref:RAB6-interacting golgin n=1 Tax=Crassostrea virginica TaxID=6565 RepID=A0A8B8D0T1_CRAVI|nr:RAB6-interacting golgin-like isoform X3 [Crassostrea virginica]
MSPSTLAQDRGTNEADYNESHARRVPNILSTSKNKSPKENSCPGGNKIPKQQTQVATSKPEEEMVTEIKEEVTEIDDSEALSREINNLDKFRDQQKMIEEANKQRKALLSKTLTERQRKAREEAQKLSHIQKELQLLDNRLSADVTLIRSRIESSSKDYLEAQRRYDRAEREFIEAKMDLQKKSELKEQLTEHLYTIIHQNELRKAEKLSQLMNELQMENESEGNGVQLSSLPPLSAFNAMGLSTLNKIQSNDPSALGSSSTKTTVKSSESNKAEKHNTTCESSNLAEENTNNSLCHIMTESQNTTDDSANSSTTAEKRQGQVGRKQENGEPPSQLETMPDLASSTEKEKSVPTSWTLDVIIKQEPEENG